MDTFESLSHSVWECKYHVVFIPKCRRKTLYGTLRATSGRGVPEVGHAEGESDRRRAAAPGPRAHADRETAEVCGVAGGWVYQERHPLGARLRGAPAQLRRAAFLGAWLLRVDRRRDERIIREYIRSSRKKPISDWINWDCGVSGPPAGWR